MKQIYTHRVTTPVGRLLLGSYEGQLCLADWYDRKARKRVDQRLQKSLHAEYVDKDTEILVQTRAQIDAYFRGERKIFDIPFFTVGTDLQKSVWKALGDIPYGETLSYLALSKKIGNEKAVRAVASAVGLNAMSIIIPCHRVIGSDGSLRGYAGGLEVKQKLLDLESDRFTLS